MVLGGGSLERSDFASRRDEVGSAAGETARTVGSEEAAPVLGSSLASLDCVLVGVALGDRSVDDRSRVRP